MLLAYEKMRISLSWRKGLLLAFLVVLQCLTNWYTAFFVVLILGWKALFDLASKRLSKKVVVALVGVLASAVLLCCSFFHFTFLTRVTTVPPMLSRKFATTLQTSDPIFSRHTTLS